MKSVIEVASLRKTFKGRDRLFPRGVEGSRSSGRWPARIPLHPRTVGLRQVDLAQRPRRARQSLRRAGQRSGGRVGYLFQEPRLLPWMTAEAKSRFRARSCKVRALAPGRTEIPLSRHDRPVGISRLLSSPDSGGMAQRLALVRALCVEPGILLMDEPFSGLDEITARRIRSDLLTIWEETRKTIVFVTHNAYEACFLADRILVICRRRVPAGNTRSDRAAAQLRRSRPSSSSAATLSRRFRRRDRPRTCPIRQRSFRAGPGR